MRKSLSTEEQVAMALRQTEAGKTVEEICRKLRVGSATFSPWKKVYGRLGVLELRELAAARAQRSSKRRTSRVSGSEMGRRALLNYC